MEIFFFKYSEPSIIFSILFHILHTHTHTHIRCSHRSKLAFPLGQCSVTVKQVTMVTALNNGKNFFTAVKKKKMYRMDLFHANHTKTLIIPTNERN